MKFLTRFKTNDNNKNNNKNKNHNIAEHYPVNTYLFKVRNRITRKRFETCSKLTIKDPNDVNDVALVFLSLTLNIFHTLL